MGEEITFTDYFNPEEDFILNSNTYRAFCDNCHNHTTVYALKQPLKEYTNREAFEKMQKLQMKMS